MRIAVGSDHAGFELKRHVAEALRRAGHDVLDVGADTADPADYPQYGASAARLVADGGADRGVVVCGSGVGIAIAANKIAGIRAVNAHDPDEAEMARRHNDANVLALSGRRLAEPDADAIVAAFLDTPFDGGRHQRRLDQISDLERTP